VIFTISRQCPQCQRFQIVEVQLPQNISCPNCASRWGRVETLESVFEKCPVCECKQFWVQKDFNQALGCFIMLIGIVLVPLTYGLSLPVFALWDWLIYRRLPNYAVCYRCASEFRGFVIPARLKSFLHHIGLKYDRYR